jgi:pyranose oxidase
MKRHPEDPIHIPFEDPEPQLTMKYTEKTPWHTQIHRDAFSYGDVGPKADPRVIVDLRFFGKQEVEQTNYVEFSTEHTDIYGMPQATVSSFVQI